MDSNNNIYGGNNQILPNATSSYQFFIGNDITRKLIGRSDSVTATIKDMCSFSSTIPDIPDNEIIRERELNFIDERLQSDTILCLTGAEGVGLSTLLSQFARRHGSSCVSYFYSGLDRYCIEQEVIERNIVEQLHWYIFGKFDDYDERDADNYTISMLYHKTLRTARESNEPLYFVFDGFDRIPSEKLEGIKRLIGDLLWSRCKYVFSGNPQNIAKILGNENMFPQSTNEVLCLAKAEMKEYFCKDLPDIDECTLDALYDITHGNAHRMSVILHSYIRKGRLEELLMSNMDRTSDLYDSDFNTLFSSVSNDNGRLFALLCYAEFPLSLAMISEILRLGEDEVRQKIEQYNEYIQFSIDGFCTLRSEGFHKYLREKLHEFKQEVELSTIAVLEKEEYIKDYCAYIPAIYKSLNMQDKLVKYLNTENVQRIMIDKKSQAALNEQSDFGYDACAANYHKHAPSIFRFAINKSASREMEKNELWDYEIEALLAVGEINQAIALAQSVYLKEERLKSFLLIARKRKKLQSEDYNTIKENIDQLVKTIDFENLPNKAVELAKLLMPIDYSAAIGIVDRIARQQKEPINTDRLYTIMSMLSEQWEDEGGNINKADQIYQKIQDDDLRQFASATRSLFSNCDVDYFLGELAKLPNNSQKLHLLKLWLPEHEDMDNIGKAILEAIHLIVLESDTEMPKARVLNVFCQSMHKMTMEQMSRALVYIDSIKESIMNPTLDYVDAILTIIESIKDKMPEKAMDYLVELFIHIHDIADDSIRLTCLSKLLGKFDKLGNRRQMEKRVCSTVDLRKEIMTGINALLKKTASHYKIVEGPIKALVCSYKSMIDEILRDVNTEERRCKAYSKAAMEYVRKEVNGNFDLNYFFELIRKTKYMYYDYLRPLNYLTLELLYAEGYPNDRILPVLKRNFDIIEGVESAFIKSILSLNIFLWFKKYYPEDTFASKVKAIMDSSLNDIDDVSDRIEQGFRIAKSIAKYSKEEAMEYICKSRELKTGTMLSSMSSESTYDETLDLYTRSMCNLIRLDAIDDELLNDYTDDVSICTSSVKTTRLWCKVALEYYLNGRTSQFNDISNKHIPQTYDKYTVYEQKCIIHSSSPILFIRSQEKFFSLLKNYDEFFANECIRQVVFFIFDKENFIADINTSESMFDMDYQDYWNILTLLNHSSSDELYFYGIRNISQSLRQSNKKDVLSTEQRKDIINEATRVVTSNLPTKNGIKHDGYKIACLAYIERIDGEFTSEMMKKWSDMINSVDNLADRSFLYLTIAPMFRKRSDKDSFFHRGINTAEGITSIYDKVHRLDMSIQECIDNNLKNLIPDVARKAFASLSYNDSLEEYKKLTDMVYQYKPELAGQLVENIDTDPVRIHYKEKLKKYIESNKKLDKAKKEMKSLNDLNLEEQIKFFETSFSNLVQNKAQTLELDKAFSLSIDHIYNNSIVDAKPAILYLMETVSRRHRLANNQKELLLTMHESIRYNMKLVLSLAAGSKSRIDCIERLINKGKRNVNGLFRCGEGDKAIQYLLDWYSKYKYDRLFIIDPYFKPSNLHIIKTLCDINNSLSIGILCHLTKYQPQDYRDEWNSITTGILSSVKIDFLHYKDTKDDGPLHDRYWICYDENTNKYVGIKTNSIDSYGKKESSITELEEAMALGIHMDSYAKYVYMHIRKVEEHEIEYYSVELK